MNMDEDRFLSFADMVSDELASRRQQRPKSNASRFRQIGHTEKSMALRSQRMGGRTHRSLGDSFLSTVEGGYSDTEASTDEQEGRNEYETSYASRAPKLPGINRAPVCDHRTANPLNGVRAVAPAYGYGEQDKSAPPMCLDRTKKTSRDMWPNVKESSCDTIAASSYGNVQMNGKGTESLEEIRIKELVKENVLLTREVDRLSEELVMARSQQEEHKEALMKTMTEKHERRIQVVKDEFEMRLNEEKERNVKAEKQADKTLSIATEKIEQLETELQTVLRKLSEAEEAKKKEECTVKEGKEKIKAFEQQVTAALNTVTQFSEKQVSMARDYEHLQETLRETNKIIKENEAKVDSLQKDNLSLRNELDQKISCCKRMNSEIRSYTKGLNSSKMAFDDLKHKYLSLQGSLKSKQDQIYSEKQRNAVLQKEIETLRNQVETFSLKNSELSVQAAQYAEVAKTSWNEAQSMKQEAQLLRQRLRQYEDTVQHLQSLIVTTPTGDNPSVVHHLHGSNLFFNKKQGRSSLLKPTISSNTEAALLRMHLKKDPNSPLRLSSFIASKDHDAQPSSRSKSHDGITHLHSIPRKRLCQDNEDAVAGEATEQEEHDFPSHIQLPPHASNWLNQKVKSKKELQPLRHRRVSEQQVKNIIDKKTIRDETDELSHESEKSEFNDSDGAAVSDDCNSDFSSAYKALGGVGSLKFFRTYKRSKSQEGIIHSPRRLYGVSNCVPKSKQVSQSRSRDSSGSLQHMNSSIVSNEKKQQDSLMESDGDFKNIVKRLPRLLTSLKKYRNTTESPRSASVAYCDDGSKSLRSSFTSDPGRDSLEHKEDSEDATEQLGDSHNPSSVEEEEPYAARVEHASPRTKDKDIIHRKDQVTPQTKGTLLFSHACHTNKRMTRLIKIHSPTGHCRYELQNCF